MWPSNYERSPTPCVCTIYPMRLKTRKRPFSCTVLRHIRSFTCICVQSLSVNPFFDLMATEDLSMGKVSSLKGFGRQPVCHLISTEARIPRRHYTHTSANLINARTTSGYLASMLFLCVSRSRCGQHRRREEACGSPGPNKFVWMPNTRSCRLIFFF